MSLSCDNSLGSNVVGQQLFLGSSVVSFNSNLGWGGSASTLTVELADDFGCFSWGDSNANPYAQVIQIKEPVSNYNPLSTCNQPYETHPNYDIANHYYNCVGNSCYIDEHGFPYNPNRDPNSCSGASKIKVVPGKVYHRCTNTGLDQYYWRYTDPGFFGNKTRIDPNGVLSNNEWRYNLIGIPVYFRFGYYTFGGIVTSWTCDNRIGTPKYTVEIISADNLLRNCKVILSKFVGSIFTTVGNDKFGGPTNFGIADKTFSGLSNIRHFGQNKFGNLPNVFNVYGFLESYGYGTSDLNDNGIPLAHIIDSLCVLTSANGSLKNSDSFNRMRQIFPDYNPPNNNNKLGSHNAFSPYARIIAPSLMTDDSINPIYANFGSSGTDYGFGIIPATLDQNNIPRTEFLLDLSEVPRPPLDVRYNANDGHGDIIDIIREACQRTGRDFYTTIIRKNGLNFIKIKTIDRTTTYSVNNIEYVVKSLETSGLPVSASQFGKEKNDDAKPRTLYVGANQQRLFQTKSLLLGYSNAHLVYHPMLGKFIDYYRFGKNGVADWDKEDGGANRWNPDNSLGKWCDAYKLPLAYSTRNRTVSDSLNSSAVTALFDTDQSLIDKQGNSESPTNGDDMFTGEPGSDPNRSPYNTDDNNESSTGLKFDSLDQGFIDGPVLGSAPVKLGNYWPSKNHELSQENINNANKKDNDRFIPLWHCAVSPFFGYALDQLINLSDTSVGSNIHRFIRPVYLDTWTGMLVIGFRMNEAPLLNLGNLFKLYDYRFNKPTDWDLAAGGGIQSGKNPAGAEKKNGDEKNDPKIPDEEAKKNQGVNPVEPVEGGVGSSFWEKPENLFGRIDFVVTETELRAAAMGWENYLSYCLMKLPVTKPDLFKFLVTVYKTRGKLYLDKTSIELGFDVPGMGSHKNPGGAENQAGKDTPAQINNLPQPEYTKLNYNWNWTLNYEFIKDLQIIVEFLKNIHNQFYGKKYMVRIPELLTYKDKQYADIQIPSTSIQDISKNNNLGENIFQQKIGSILTSIGSANPQEALRQCRQLGYNISITHLAVLAAAQGIQINPYAIPGIGDPCTAEDDGNYYTEADLRNKKPNFAVEELNPKDTIAIYTGSGKLFSNKELVDGAWEEYGNDIDDCIMVGSPDYFKLCQENGLIPPLLGYNANPNVDRVSKAWCELDLATKKEKLKNLPKEIQQLAPIDEGLTAIRSGIENAPVLNLLQNILPAAGQQAIDAVKSAVKGVQENYNKQLKLKQKLLEYLQKRLPDCSKEFLVPSLDLGSVTEPYVLVSPKDTLSSRTDAYDEIISDDATAANMDKYSVKMYIPTTCDPNLAFVDPISLSGPRAIINSPGVDLYFGSMSFQDDPNLTVINNAVSEDLGVLNKINISDPSVGLFIKKVVHNMIWGENGELVKDQQLTREQAIQHVKNLLISRLIGLRPDGKGGFTTDSNIDAFFIQNTARDVSTRHRMVAPKKANPFYAAIPLKDNQNCYGPWTNYPALLANINYKVFPGVVNKNQILEQMIGDIDLQMNQEWAPWNYGGMGFLDREIILRMDERASYQSILERGTVTIQGMPLINLSGGVRYRLTDYDVHIFRVESFMDYQYQALIECGTTAYNGLTIGSISTSVSDRNVSTTYKFQTYSTNLGIFNKEVSERNKLIATTSIRLASQIGKTNRELEQKILKQVDAIVKNSRTRGDGAVTKASWQSDLFGNSPTQLLIGNAEYYLPNAGLPISADPGLNSTKYRNLRNDISDAKTEAEYNINSTRTRTFVGGFMMREALAELEYGYGSKAAMSFDGIFSPVSFFPANNLGTFSISSRFVHDEIKGDNVLCPRCFNSKIVTYERNFNGTMESIEYPCPLCNKTRTFFPPVTGQNKPKTPEVNLVSLNPIVVPYGDFRNPNSQLHPLERSRHNISIIGRQDSPQIGSVGFDINDNLSLTCDPVNGEADIELVGTSSYQSSIVENSFVNPDFNQYDLSFVGPDAQSKSLLNNRFFALRGPLMLHGWGYDTEGYPVPNQADEPKAYDSKGRPLRFKLTSSGTNDYKQDGAYLPTADYGLGDIIGSGYEKKEGIWKRTPKNYFHLNWAERSDLWPIGPIDLRWDKKRQVWVGGGGCEEIEPPYIIASGSNTDILVNYISQTTQSSDKKCPYKMMYAVLEENLIKINDIDETYPARGFLDDLEYNIDPLPQNTRRLIYIKDRCGYTAPRGAKLLCRYDRDTGFYEPITKQQYIVFGIITGGNNAIIDLTYIQGIKSPENMPKMNIIFDNTRFNFVLSGKKKGMFMFENGKWILIGTN